MIKLTPAHLRLLCGCASSEQIRTLVVGREDFKRDLARKAAALFPRCVIYSRYGPTEATVSCMIYRYTGKKRAFIAHRYGDVASGNLLPLRAVGVPGKLVNWYGASVTQGYIVRRNKRPPPAKSTMVMIGYRSGDISCAIAPNTLVYRGQDDQSKLMAIVSSCAKSDKALWTHLR